ncbi:MAG: hypothetical protein MUF00_03225 [Gemmatimonadaceae bacterium]|jgi:hypothetical protein|nr:hypothetical protein [Gemmatimonadaceae bacterium]
MDVSFALFADAANLSQEGKLNILGVFDAVHVQALPAVHPRATIVVRLKGQHGDGGMHTITLRWTNPRGDVLWQSDADLQFADPPPGATEADLPVVGSVDLPIDSGGVFHLAIVLDGAERVRVPLHVHVGQPTPIAPMRGMVS